MRSLVFRDCSFCVQFYMFISVMFKIIFLVKEDAQSNMNYWFSELPSTNN